MKKQWDEYYALYIVTWIQSEFMLRVKWMLKCYLPSNYVHGTMHEWKEDVDVMQNNQKIPRQI